jgi:hypothetical protein
MARAVTLVVENGSIVTDANSFVSEDELVAYAAARGVTLPYTTDANKDAVAVLAIKAMDYLRVQPWKGEVVDTDQTTPWPRKNTYTTPVTPEDVVPAAVKEAQFQLALIAQTGFNLLPFAAGTGILIKEKIGPVENMYSEKAGVSSNGMPIIPGIGNLLQPWLLGSYDGFVPVSMTSLGRRDIDGG